MIIGNSLEKMTKEPILAYVTDNVKVSDGIYQATFDCREIAKKAIPGQFVSILCRDLTLRRPFSIAYVDGTSFQVLYKVKGEGTEYISKLKPGESVDIIGPLGNGFNISEKNALLIGGGVGVAPLIYLSKILREKKVQHTLLAGFQKMPDISEIYMPKSYVITEDGSSGLGGRVNEYVRGIINHYKPEKIYACGPTPVLKFIAETSEEYSLEFEAALEREFACGIGVCMGCTIQVEENGNRVNKRICKEGPVFNGRSVIW